VSNIEYFARPLVPKLTALEPELKRYLHEYNSTAPTPAA
jgi:hypothetical protein